MGGARIFSYPALVEYESLAWRYSRVFSKLGIESGLSIDLLLYLIELASRSAAEREVVRPSRIPAIEMAALP